MQISIDSTISPGATVAINSAGTIVAADDRGGFRWRNGERTSLPLIPDDIDDLDRIVGRIVEGPGLYHAGIRQSGVLTDLNTQVARRHSRAYGGGGRQ